jgi:hypothetical protein
MQSKDQAAPPGRPAESGYAGPTIQGHRLEATPTLDANSEALMQRAPPGRCIKPHCSGRLDVFRGLVLTEGGNGTKVPEVSERNRRQSYVACEVCRTPVPVNHPRQQELDRAWQEREQADKLEADRAQKQRAAQASSPAKPPPVNEAMTLPDAVQRAHDRIDRLEATVQKLTYRVADLEKKLAERPAEMPF